MPTALQQILGLLIMTFVSPALATDTTRTQTIVNPTALFDPAPFGYSHAVVASGSKRIAYLAGQGGANNTGALSPEFDRQVEQAFANLQAVLDEMGATSDQVTMLTIYVVDHNQSKLGPVTKAVQEMFGAALPAQTLVPVPRLALDGMLFEVDAIAVLD
jgi:enamine deaminase RidA (YjgF/YER057c/UK114 family)